MGCFFPFFQFDEGQKLKNIKFNGQACNMIYEKMMNGFQKETGHLQLQKLISATNRKRKCALKDINTYENHHGNNTSES